MPKKLISFLAYIVIAAWLGFAFAEALHDEAECEDEDCIVCFAIHAAQDVLIKITKAANVFQIIVLVPVSLLIFIKVLHIRIDTPVLCKVRLDL